MDFNDYVIHVADGAYYRGNYTADNLYTTLNTATDYRINYWEHLWDYADDDSRNYSDAADALSKGKTKKIFKVSSSKLRKIVKKYNTCEIDKFIDEMKVIQYEN